MSDLIMSFSEEDDELIGAIKEMFGDSVIYEKNKNFDGLGFLLTAVVPLASLTVQIIDFILTYFHKNNDSSNNKSKRILITKEGDLNLKGYTEDEAIKIIKGYFELQNDKK